MPDIFDEVSEDLQAERAARLLRRYGGLLIAAMVATLAGVGFYTWRQEQQSKAADQAALRFIAAQKEAARPIPGPSALTQMQDIAEAGPDGYRLLARFQMAALQWNAGQHDRAIAEWDRIAADQSVSPLFRDLAILMSVQHQADSADPHALKAQLAPVMRDQTRLKPMAEEVNALLDLRLGRQKEAAETFRSLAADPQSPQGVRQMAQDALASMGGDGAGPRG